MRYYTNEDNQFKEGILAFDRRIPFGSHEIFKTSNDERLFSYLIFDFRLPKKVIFEDFEILESKEIELIKDENGTSLKKAFVSPVKLPERINFINSHFFTLGLSAICSFAFERPVVSTKTDRYNKLQIANDEDLKDIGLEYPRTTAGPGSSRSRVHSSVSDLMIDRLKHLVSIVYKVMDQENKKSLLTYNQLMQSFRLVQLAHINKIGDFDLSYSFLVAGAETIAQIAIPQTSIPKHKSHKKWKSLSRENKLVKELFDEYNYYKNYFNNEIKNRDLTKRFTDFLLNYNSKSNWDHVVYDDLIRDGLHYRDLYSNEVIGFSEHTSNNISHEKLEKSIKGTYRLRSKFFHEGENLPHMQTVNRTNGRFFHVINDNKKLDQLRKKMQKENRRESPHSEWSETEIFLITFEFMSYLVRNSITNYLEEILSNKKSCFLFKKK